MFGASEVFVEIADVERDALLVEVLTPVGRCMILGNVRQVGRILYVDRAHIGGLLPGALGRAGLNVIGRKFLEQANVDEIVIEGSTRTSGRMAGRTPRTIRLRRT